MVKESFKEFSKRITDLKEFSQGWRGKIYTGYLDNIKVAIKTPKNPEFVNQILKEAEILSIVNKHNLGNKLIYKGKDFFVYEFIEGKPLIEILNETNAKILILQLLKQGRILDKLKISKDELHRPYTNVLVDNDNYIHLIDFERAKRTDKPQNVTQILQFIMNISNDYFPFIEKQRLIELAKKYKREQTEKNFEEILKYLHF
jgi:putative serine/threonine protein kinase